MLSLARPRLAKFQFTISRAMIVTAVFAILLAFTRSGLAATVIFSLVAFYYGIGRCVAPGPPLPQRHPTGKPKFFSGGQGQSTVHFD
jgi:hypothetical protein